MAPLCTGGRKVVDRLQFLEARERFLPLKQTAMRDRMLSDSRLSAGEREQLSKLFEMLAARFHFEFREKLEHLKAAYDPFDPDCDTQTPPDASAEQEAKRKELARAFEELLLDANFVEMSREQVIACAEYQAHTGLVVKANLSDYAQLQVFYRGIRHVPRTVRLWLPPRKPTDETAHVFSRVAVFVRLANRPNGPVFLKLFKNVVAEDLEMLLPYVRIRMRLFDHLKIGSSVAGGVATASWKVFTATILSPWLLLLVLAGFSVAATRGILSFLSSKTKYMQALSSSLYFQNLANNTSALAHLVDSAEAEECKELLLAYYILYVERDCNFTQEQLDRRVEQWLRTEFDLDVDFEVSDAVRKLFDKQLLVRRPAPRGTLAGDGILKVYDLPSTLRRLDAVWDAYYSYNGARSPDQDRLADVDWPVFPCPMANCAVEEGTQEAATVRRTDPAEASSNSPAAKPQPRRQPQEVPHRAP
jgi:hypothetical protein